MHVVSDPRNRASIYPATDLDTLLVGLLAGLVLVLVNLVL